MNCARIATNCDGRNTKVNKINTIAILAETNKMSEILCRKINTIAIPQFIPAKAGGNCAQIPLNAGYCAASPTQAGR